VGPRLHVSGFVCIRKHFVADSKLYASTRIRIFFVFHRPHVRKNETNTLESLTEHALSHAMSPRCSCRCYNSGEKTSPMLCQLSYAVRSVRVCDISELSLVPSISMQSSNINDFFSVFVWCTQVNMFVMLL
jgi:hypothetical protein